MKRVWGVLLAFIMLVGLAPAAGAHNLSTAAAFTRKGSEVTIRLTDVYGAAVEGGTGAVSVGRQKAPLSEVEPGTYRGSISAPGTETFELLVEITVLDELFRGGLNIRADEDFTDRPVIMVPIDKPLQHLTWGSVLYGAAALVLIVATVAAIRRQRNVEDEEG